MSFERAYCKDTTTALEYARRAWTLMAKGDPEAIYSNQYKLTWTIRLYQDGQHDRAHPLVITISRLSVSKLRHIFVNSLSVVEHEYWEGTATSQMLKSGRSIRRREII